MAQIALTTIGQTLGTQLLPQGIGALGLSISGSAIGGALGGVAGRAIDGALFGQTREGPRLESVRLMESREGAGVANVYGRMRIGGQVVWAARLKETRTTERVGGGKGGPRVSNYTYSASFAVALCEGVINRIDRVWSNGEVIALSDLPHRLYRGTETQAPDPLIEAIEGPDCAPAYRGIAYLVFEDLPLDDFGNRLPQLSFEILREAPAPKGSGELVSRISGVNVIPASGEFVYGTEPVRQHYFPAIETPENVHTLSGRADMLVSLDQLESDLPGVDRAAMTIGWFGTDLRADICQIRPGVETRDKETRPYAWRAGGVGRSEAWLISGSDANEPNYGGTPADRAVIQGIQEMVSRGIATTITPFLFMDISPGNGLTDPYGSSEQAAFPWRGRITANSGPGARADIDLFLGDAQHSDFEIDGFEIDWKGPSDDWGYRRFVLHHAWLARAAGGIEAFLIGSEMRALTRVRDENGQFPFVEGLRALAADVRQILGPDVKVSYAADWTEYGAFVPGDGSGDVLFPLDPLWADQNVDFVGIDWYPPVGDWRQGASHLDILAGYMGPDDPEYLLHQMAGGEAYDWFYASEADRANQVRTQIVDTAHNEHWVFRQKDLLGWWQSAHHARPGGARSVLSTEWVPGSKPVRLSEIGFPAVDRGGNAPNLFYDPKSSESALPPYSTGERDDLFQRRALDISLDYWQSKQAIEAAYVWAWDARPWPVFPIREDIWSDGANWKFGHWLNGRAGLSELGRVIEDICLRAGVPVDASRVDGLIEGFALSGVSRLREALWPLMTAFGLELVEEDGALLFQIVGQGSIQAVQGTNIGSDGPVRTRKLLDKPAGALRLTYTDGGVAYQPATVEARNPEGDRGVVLDMTLPVLMTETRAQAVADRLLLEASDREEVMLTQGLIGSTISAGDRVRVDGLEDVWRVSDLADQGQVDVQLIKDSAAGYRARSSELPVLNEEAATAAPPQLLLIDLLRLPGETEVSGPLVAAFGTPWSRPVTIRAGSDVEDMPVRAEAIESAGIGRLLTPLRAGPLGRWDEANVLHLEIPGEILSSRSALAVLNGANALLIDAGTGWEMVTYRSARLLGSGQYEVSGLLRGLQGTEIAEAQAGAICVIADHRLVRAFVSEDEHERPLRWQASGRGGAGEPVTSVFRNRASVSLAPVHVRAQSSEDGTLSLSWMRRSLDIGDNWREVAFPNFGIFTVQLYRNGDILWSRDVPSAAIEIGTDWLPGDRLQIHEVGADGRPGLPVFFGL